MTQENTAINAQAELSKALTALQAARALGDLGMYDDAASRLYYAAFHLVSAALVMLGVQAHSHGGVASLLGQHLIRPGLVPSKVGRDFAVLLGLRGQADYNRHFQLDAAGFAEELQRAESLFVAITPFLQAQGLQLPETTPPRR